MKHKQTRRQWGGVPPGELKVYYQKAYNHLAIRRVVCITALAIASVCSFEKMSSYLSLSLLAASMALAARILSTVAKDKPGGDDKAVNRQFMADMPLEHVLGRPLLGRGLLRLDL